MSNGSRLHNFVNWWKEYGRGDEKGEAQIFLDRLFQAFGHAGIREAGGTLEHRIRRHEGEKSITSFADLVVPGLVLIEMKKRGEDLRKHYQQAFQYWINLVPNRPQYVILSNFDEFWIYDLNKQIDDPLDRVQIADLHERWGAMAFLYPPDSRQHRHVVFGNDLVAVTEEAAKSLSLIFKSLARRSDVQREQAQRFVLQCMLALFAEDIGLLPKYTFTQVIEDCQRGESSYDLITMLFNAMNYRGKTSAGRFAGVDYFNGGIFATIDPIELSGNELQLLRDAAKLNWSKIRPAIFGTIFEQSMEQQQRHRTGAYFTSEVDIQRIVQPVIVHPWQERINAADHLAQLVLLLQELRQYQVLDPACGSGNFLYVAYREMKRLEKLLLDKINSVNVLPLDIGLYDSRVSSHQFWGYDVNPFAVELAKVTLMIGKKLAVDELELDENPLPLDNLNDNIRVTDALFTEWVRFDACIGNPPYQGAKLLKQEQPVEYINRIRAAYPDVPGNADYCVYWFRKAHDRMEEGTRTGLVSTNTVRQNYSRIGSLDHIIANDGRIFEAVSSMPWSGDAKVHVSIVCWTKGELPQPPKLWLDGTQFVQVNEINSSLSAKTDVSQALSLSMNTEPKRTFQGQTPGDDGFILTPDEVQRFLKQDPSYQQIIFPYLIGDDLLGNLRSEPERFIIDFGGRDVMQSRSYKHVFEHIEKHVLPTKKAKAEAQEQKNRELLQLKSNATINRHHIAALDKWWLHFYERSNMKDALQSLSRYIVCSRVTKRPIFDFVNPNICPGDSLQVFAFEDDYSFGILQSRLHIEWFLAKCSSWKSDPRYTSSTIFANFPWPQQPSDTQIQKVAEAARELLAYRYDILSRIDLKLTLREMYSSLELPGKNPLRDYHVALDEAVIEAYGFEPDSDLLAQLLALNFAVVERIEAGELVTAPGIPATYSTPESLVSRYAIQPPEFI